MSGISFIGGTKFLFGACPHDEAPSTECHKKVECCASAKSTYMRTARLTDRQIDFLITYAVCKKRKYYFLITYGVRKKRKYCNRMSEKIKFSPFDECSCFVRLRRPNGQKKSVYLSGCTYVRGLSLWTQLLSKELANPHKIWWVSSMYEM